MLSLPFVSYFDIDYII